MPAPVSDADARRARELRKELLNESVAVEDRYYDDDVDCRLYVAGGYYPSTTSVIGEMDCWDDGALIGWKARNDGVGRNPYWKHLLWFARQVGILFHVDVEEKLSENWNGERERRRAKAELWWMTQKEVRDDAWPDVLYSVLRDAGRIDDDPGRYWARKPHSRGEVRYQALMEIWDRRRVWERACRELGIHQAMTIAAEHRMVSDRVGGTCDLLDVHQGNVRLTDWKTGSRILPKHQFQVEIYRRMVPVDIDVCQVVRIGRDDWARSTNRDEDWIDVDEYLDEFESERSNLSVKILEKYDSLSAPFPP